jgi:aspartyl-tRNA(Asn)/glutamyl-tRNA(Gln) amidotransferase subunit A
MYLLMKKFMANLTNLSIVEASTLIKQKKITSTELVKAHIEVLENDPYNAFIIKTPELALEQAKKSDERVMNNTAGIIEGIPIGVKDLFCTEGIQTTSGSKMLKGFVPQYESTVTSLLYANGGVCIGKTNMDEFAMGSSNMTSYYGNVINPWKGINGEDLVPGGSSGGSAAAVAGKLCMGSLGSDTGGSIRQPAAFCGIVGIKPTYGRCSRWGMIAFASSLDQAGIFTRSVEDGALLLQAICGYDPKDSTCENMSVPDWSSLINDGVKGMKVGIPREYAADGISNDVIKTWEDGKNWLKDAGAEIVDISLPHTNYALPVYYTIAPAEASANLARFDGIRYGLRHVRDGQSMHEMISESRGEGFGKEVRRRMLIGKYVLSSFSYDEYYLQAQKIRRLIYNDFLEAFKSIDVILAPTTPTPAFSIANPPTNPVDMYLNDIFTIPASLAGLPTMSVPTHLVNGLPIGLQLIGKHFDETSVMKVGIAIEKAAKFKSL